MCAFLTIVFILLKLSMSIKLVICSKVDKIYGLLEFMLQKPTGLISLLDEESNSPEATDLTFASKLKQHLTANRCFKGESGGAFSIQHYAGEVRFSYCSRLGCTCILIANAHC